MANQKIKQEVYTNFGGINSKASPYLTGPLEFLDLKNVDFQTPGSLCPRWGSTQYVSQGFSAPITALTEFSRLSGTSQVIIAHSGGIWAGATTGQSQGMSFTQLNATLQPGSLYYTSAVVIFANSQRTPVLTAADTTAQYNNNFVPGASVYIQPSLQQDNTLSFAALNNFLFMADGNKFVKYDGTTTTLVSLPFVSIIPDNVTGGPTIYGTSNGSGSSGLAFTAGAGSSNGIIVYLSYVNNRGFEGPITPIVNVPQGLTTSMLGGTYLSLGYNIETPLEYGITTINQYMYYFTGPSFLTVNPFSVLPTFVNTTPVSGSTLTFVNLGSTVGASFQAFGSLGNFPPTQYHPLGETLTFFTPYAPPINYVISNYYPRYLEIYQNRLFSAGFSGTLSTVWFSDTGEPEGYQPDFNFEVRTNDADYITCLKTYITSLIIGKKESVHVLYGDNPNNFYLKEISHEYGIMNNRCAVTDGKMFWFLDRKGIMVWNGSSADTLSNKIQPIFQSMNYNVALNTACMVHDNLRNQILCAIPINGATLNNITVVYDYLVNAWTTYDSFTPTVFATIQGRNNTKNAFYGSFSGMVNYFGPSFITDPGNSGATTYFKTRFLHDLGESYTKQFRRLYLNIDPPSATMSYNINFYKDFGSSIVYSTTMPIDEFQNRIDYGIPAKSLAFEASNVPAIAPIRVHGFTIESRLQRTV